MISSSSINRLKVLKKRKQLQLKVDSTNIKQEEFIERGIVREIIRKNQLVVLQLKNELLKKQIQTKKLKKNIQEARRQINTMKQQKAQVGKNLKKFEIQRKQAQTRIALLQQKVEELTDDNNAAKQIPRDRYNTCLRELDLLKTTLDNQEMKIIKQRDFYKDIFEEVKCLVESDLLNQKELKNNLKAIFSELFKDFGDGEGLKEENFYE